MSVQCKNLTADRELGKYWERQFCKMAGDFGFMFTPMQIGHEGAIEAFKKDGAKWNPFLLPDVTIWTAPGQHHEIKHKNPTKDGLFGLEDYRFRSLVSFARETGQDVMYTIHNHDLAGGRDSKVNNMAHWLTVNVLSLVGKWKRTDNGSSWVNGAERQVVRRYWDPSLWTPLAKYWGLWAASAEYRSKGNIVPLSGKGASL